jgi:hypothetical protein
MQIEAARFGANAIASSAHRCLLKEATISRSEVAAESKDLYRFQQGFAPLHNHLRGAHPRASLAEGWEPHRSDM